MNDKDVSARRGVQKLLTLDPEANDELETRALGSKSQGRLVSRLLLEDRVRREERARLRQERLGGPLEPVGIGP